MYLFSKLWALYCQHHVQHEFSCGNIRKNAFGGVSTEAAAEAVVRGSSSKYGLQHDYNETPI